MEIAISVDSLLKLPVGAVYHKRSGQARAEVTKQGDTIYVTGTCDSLQRQVDYYEALYHTARDALENYHNVDQEEKRVTVSPTKVFVIEFILGLITGISLVIFITIHKRHGKE